MHLKREVPEDCMKISSRSGAPCLDTATENFSGRLPNISFHLHIIPEHPIMNIYKCLLLVYSNSGFNEWFTFCSQTSKFWV